MNERRGLGRRSRRSDEEVRPQAADGCTRRGLHKARARPSSASSGVVRELPVVDVDNIHVVVTLLPAHLSHVAERCRDPWSRVAATRACGRLGHRHGITFDGARSWRPHAQPSRLCCILCVCIDTVFRAQLILGVHCHMRCAWDWRGSVYVNVWKIANSTDNGTSKGNTGS